MRKASIIILIAILIPLGSPVGLDDPLDVRAYAADDKIQVSMWNNESVEASDIRVKFYTDEFRRNFSVEDLKPNESVNFSLNGSAGELSNAGFIRWNLTADYSHSYTPEFDVLEGGAQDLQDVRVASDKSRDWPINIGFSDYTLDSGNSPSLKTLTVAQGKADSFSSFNIDYQNNIQDLKVDKGRRANPGTEIAATGNFTTIEMRFSSGKSFDPGKKLRPKFSVNYSMSDSGVTAVENYGSSVGLLTFLKQLADLLLGSI